MIENFGNKINSNGLDKNPQNINMKGAPKLISGVLQELKEKGYKQTNSAEVKAIYMTLVQLSNDDLIEMQKSKNEPLLTKIVIESILEGKGFEIIEKMFDRALGKSVQKNETRQVDKDGEDLPPITKVHVVS